MPADICRFADFELDRSAYQLRRNGRRQRIERIPLDLLFLLAESPGQVVTRDQILERIWGKDVFLDTDNSINAAVRKIRRALHDDAEAPRFVATVPTKGYRFVASLREMPHAGSLRVGKNGVSPKKSSTVRLRSEASMRGRRAASSVSPLAQPDQSRTTSAPADGELAWGAFVGRADELAALRALIDASLVGQASLVMIAGEPGIGKTRLAEEAGVYARLRGAQVLVGHCYEGEAASPYSSFVQALRNYLATRPDDAIKAELGDGASDVAKLVSEIRKRIPDLPLSAAADPSEERMRLFDSVASFLINASNATPILLLLEDLHWADKPSLQLLHHLARSFKGSRLIVVGTYRDIELDRRHPLSTMIAELRRERLYQRVLLRGFSESEVKDLIEAISQQEVTADGEEFVRAIRRETEGNPFFVEETLRHLVEARGFYRLEGRWVTDAKSISELGVPEGVRDVIGRRLSRLSDAAYRVLASAAVLGREFEFEALSKMGEPGDETILPAFEEGLGARMMVENHRRSGSRYAFTHALVRQTLIEELSLPRKQRLHLHAAQAIEGVYQGNLEPHLAALANHYRMAGAAADPTKTIDYSIRAGYVAFAVFAYEEARAHWLAALGLMDEQGGGDKSRRARVLLALGDSVVSSGPDAIGYLEAAAILFEELGEYESAAAAHSRLGNFLSAGEFGSVDMGRAMEHLKKAESQLAGQPESSGHGEFYLGMFSACMWTNRIVDGLVAAKHAMEVGERIGNDVLLVWGEITSSEALVYSGSVTEGLRLADQARHRAEPINDTRVSTFAWIGAGTYRLLWDPREAQDWCTRELTKPRAARALDRRVLFLNLLTLASIDSGELAKARSYLAEADTVSTTGLAFFNDENTTGLLFFEGEWELAAQALTPWSERSRITGNRQEYLWSATALARLHRFSGENGQARHFLQVALNIAVEGGSILDELTTRSMLARVVAEAGESTEALPHLERCRQIVAGENWRGLAGGVERAEAAFAAAQGELPAANRHFERAIDIFRQYCRPWEEADTLQCWGRALIKANQHALAIEKLDAAIEIYRSRAAGTCFIEYLISDKMRAQGAK